MAEPQARTVGLVSGERVAAAVMAVTSVWVEVIRLDLSSAFLAGVQRPPATGAPDRCRTAARAEPMRPEAPESAILAAVMGRSRSGRPGSGRPGPGPGLPGSGLGQR